MKKQVFAVFLTLCLLVSFAGCRGEDEGGGFGFSIAAEPKQIDPQTATDTASLTVIDAVFEGLTRVENGEVKPAAADWNVSADGCTYTFTLRTSYWSTVTVRGTETGFEEPIMVTAYDFEFAIRRAADPTTNCPYAKLLYGIQNAEAVLNGEMPSTALGVKATNDTTLIITLDAPDPAFLARLATPAFMPCSREFFAFTAGRYGLETKYILTNGAFYVSGWDHNTSITLRKNTHYHAATEVLPDLVKYRVTQSADEDFELLTKGYIDAAFVPADRLDQAKTAGVRPVEMQDTVEYLWINTGVTALGNADVRRALRDAIEWNTLRENLPDNYVVATGFVPPAATAGGKPYKKETLPFTTDVNAARTALERGLLALELEKLPALTLLAADDTDSANLARYIAQSLVKNLNIRCELDLTDAETLAARVTAGNYQLAIFQKTGRGLTATENLEMFTSAASTGNYARYADTAYDTLYAAATDTVRAATTLETYLLDACPVLPLGFCTRYYGIREEVSGITVAPFDGGLYGAPLAFRQAKREK
ncbi:MAG: peptide ABC transporter substrate-binding protein [Clostridia bacterium]|nr:peptide ABC transporter substrate-binding protein [Clostridia bacterium]